MFLSFALNNKSDSLGEQQQYEIVIELSETKNLSHDLIKKYILKNHFKNTLLSFALNNKRDSLKEQE